MDASMIVRVVEAVATAVTAVVAWLAKHHAKDASQSVGPKNDQSLQDIAHELVAFHEYQQTRNHSIIDAVTATQAGVRLLCDKAGITMPEPSTRPPIRKKEDH